MTAKKIIDTDTKQTGDAEIEGNVSISGNTTINGTRPTVNGTDVALVTDIISGGDGGESAGDVLIALNQHKDDKTNPHAVTKTQVGLGNVDNTADKDKPISTAQQTALNGKVAIAQGTGNAGKVLGINESGNVEPVEAPTGGGSNVNIVQQTGQSETDVMSQKATTDALAAKVKYPTSIVGSFNDGAYALGFSGTSFNESTLHTGRMTYNPPSNPVGQIALYDSNGKLVSKDKNAVNSEVATLNDIATKLDKSAVPNQFYATDENGEQVMVDRSTVGAPDGGGESAEDVLIALNQHKSDKNNPHEVMKEQIGLGDVDNTSDEDKPLSSEQREALDALKENEDIISATIDSHMEDLTNPHKVTKKQVGLEFADNTADANKPVSAATRSALDGKLDISGEPNKIYANDENGDPVMLDMPSGGGDGGYEGPAVLQNTGPSTSAVMSQKAVTDALDGKLNTSSYPNMVYGTNASGGQLMVDIGSQLNEKVSRSYTPNKIYGTGPHGEAVMVELPEGPDVVQDTGSSEEDIMSQGAVTRELAGKLDIDETPNAVYGTDEDGYQVMRSMPAVPHVVQTRGISPTDVMSQKAVDMALATKVTISTVPDKLYGTDHDGEQHMHAIPNFGSLADSIDTKLSRSTHPNSVYGVDEYGQQVMMEIPSAIKGDGDGRYVYKQEVPSAVWTINHKLGGPVILSAYDDSGQEILATKELIDDNTARITFLSERTGTAIAVSGAPPIVEIMDESIIVHGPGDSEKDVMSQKAVTDALATKLTDNRYFFACNATGTSAPLTYDNALIYNEDDFSIRLAVTTMDVSMIITPKQGQTIMYVHHSYAGSTATPVTVPRTAIGDGTTAPLTVTVTRPNTTDSAFADGAMNVGNRMMNYYFTRGTGLYIYIAIS